VNQDFYAVAVLSLRLIFWLAILALSVLACRWADRQWRPLAAVLTLGIVIRAVTGAAFFAISYWNLPIFGGQHSGGGFWELAPDARNYFTLATASASGQSLSVHIPSPAFVGALGAWMRAAGPTPVSAVLFNLALYVASAVLIIATFRPFADNISRRAAFVSVTALSGSPVLLMTSTQVLKDVFFCFLIVVVLVAARFLLRRNVDWPWAQAAGVLAASACAVYAMAGVRAYYPVLVWGGLALGLGMRLLTLAGGQMLRFAAQSAVVLGVLWMAFVFGSGPYYVEYAAIVRRTAGIDLPFSGLPEIIPEQTGLSAARSTVETARRGFVRSGGATNLAAEERGHAGLDFSGTRAIAIGLAALFVPVTLLKALSVVSFSGGRGFLMVTDVDTLFVILGLVASLWVVFGSAGRWRHDLPFLGFVLSLALVTAVLMGYVVTNYGTLFRLRLMVATPIWLLPLLLSQPPMVAAPARSAVPQGGHAMGTPQRERIEASSQEPLR
jgi:hypothetical protein